MWFKATVITRPNADFLETYGPDGAQEALRTAIINNVLGGPAEFGGEMREDESVTVELLAEPQGIEA